MGWFDKGFGDPGSTQERDAHGEFTQGSGDSHEHYMVTGRVQGMRSGQTVRSTIGPFHSKPEANAEIARQGMIKPQFAYYAPGQLTHDEGTTKGFGDPGSTQERESNGTFGPGSGPQDAKRVYNSEALASIRSSKGVDAHGDPILNVGTKYTNSDDAAKYANSLLQKYAGDAAKDTNIEVRFVDKGNLGGANIVGQAMPPSPGMTGPIAEAAAQMGIDVSPQPNWQITLASTDADQASLIHETAHVVDAVTAAAASGTTPVGFAAWTDLMSAHGNAFNAAFVPMLQDEMPEFAQQYRMAMVRAGGLQGKSASTVRAVITAPDGSVLVCRNPFSGATSKGFGDPGSTQQQDAHGRFTAGSGASTSSLEDRAIAHFGAAEELQGQQFITPNGTILNLEGDSHDRIKEVVGGNVNTAESRAINARIPAHIARHYEQRRPGAGDGVHAAAHRRPDSQCHAGCA